MSDERGFTLVELLIAMLLLGVLGAVTTGVIVTGFHRQADVEGRAATIEQVRTALQRTLRDLRAADQVLSFSPTAVALLKGSSVTCYDVVTAAGDTSLQRRTLPADGVCSDGAGTPSTVVAHLDDTPSTPVFSVPYNEFSPSYKSDATKAATVDGYCVENGTNPQVVAPDCIGAIEVQLVVRPLNLGTGASLCPAGTTASACDVNVADSAVVRNAP